MCISLLGLCAVLAAVGPLWSLGWLGFGCVVVLLCAAVEHRKDREDRAGDTRVVPSLHLPDDVAHLSDAELCRAWRLSYVLLRRLEQHAATPRSALASVAQRRGVYLDELQRRYPDGFAAWIAAGARAPSDPLPFLQRRPTTDEAA